MLQPNFSRPIFTPDPNDPEVRLVRNRILNRYPERRARYTDELARGGLLGSGVAGNAYRQLDLDQENQVSDAENQVFARQSGQNFDLNRLRLMDELERRRQQEAAHTSLIGSLFQTAGSLAGARLFRPQNLGLSQAPSQAMSEADRAQMQKIMEQYFSGGF